MIKNIILDMGNVLLTYNPQIVLDTYCQNNEEKQVIKKSLFQSEIWIEGDKGIIKNDELYDKVKIQIDKKYWASLKACCDNWDICMKPINHAKEFCEYLKNKGYHLYILSNASDRFYHYFERLLPLSFFDGIVVSSDIKMIKPDLEIYEYILSKYQLNPLECLFIDDTSINIEAAKQLSIHAYQFNNDFQSIIEKYKL